jgi:hypothetical protein
MVWIAGAEDSWLRNYVEYARSITDAPLAFHVAGGLAAMAGAVGSNVWWRGGGGREQWPNLYLLLLAPSGIFRKSTSVDIPMNLLAKASPGSLLDREFTPERFIRNLADQPTSVLKESEFASLLERMKSNYMQGMKQRLTDLFDCQDSYDRTLQGASGGRGERISIVRPALTILAASTLDWLVESLTETDMRSGFMPRFLFFAPTLKEAEPAGGYLAEPDRPLENWLVKTLAQMSGMARRQISFAPSRRRIVGWNTDNSAVVEGGQTPDELLGLYSRLGHHLGKIAALLSVSDDGIRSEYAVAEDTAERAIALMEWILAGTGRVFEERVVFSKFELQAQKALRFIGGGIERGALLKKMKCPASELDRLLMTLKDRGEIDEYTEQTAGRPRRMIVRTLPDLSGEERGGKGEVSGEESPNGRVVSFAPAAMQGK